MNKQPRILQILSALVLLGWSPWVASAKQEVSDIIPGLVYHPEGDAIVIQDGTRWSNRPLYCNARQMVILAGEMPGLASPLGSILAGVQRGGVEVNLEDFETRIMRYRPARIEWELSDSRIPGLVLHLNATTVAEGDGFVVQVQASGAKPEDQWNWAYLPGVKKNGESLSVEFSGSTFRSGSALGITGEEVGASPVSFSKRSAFSHLKQIVGSKKNPKAPDGNGLQLTVQLASQNGVHFLAVAGDGVSSPFDAKNLFDKGMARANALAQRVSVDTPDRYFNAAVGASCAAMYGLYVAPYFVHGGLQWRVCYPGWRVMDGATAYGWHDAVATAMNYHGAKQVTKANGLNSPAADSFGAEQSSRSRLWGLGRVASGHYDMQTQLFDQCTHDWRATGNPEFAKQLLPMLELHLQWAKECFDPDNDGLYESYINTWPTDSQWYNGGGTVEESAYIYYQQRVAADLCKAAGRTEDAARHNAEADKIRNALDRVLWIKEKGRYAAYIEQGGHHRVHDDAWVYSEHLPIELGLATPEQAWQAMDYTDSEMEKFKLPYGGEMRQTSNWVPGQWSVRELYHGDNFAMALGYFDCQQADQGWELFRGTMLESMYGDLTAKSGYGSGMVNFISPGGLSQPKCSVDFNDITSMFCRTVVEGLFGYHPDYPNQVVTVAPALPSTWDHASIQTPDYRFSYKREPGRDHYEIKLTREAALQLRLPVYAEKVSDVTVNGKSEKFEIQPWAGCGMLTLKVPSTEHAEVVIALERRVPAASPLVIQKKAGEKATIPNPVDPQGCLLAEAKPGHHLAFSRVERNNVPFFQVYKVEVVDSDSEKFSKELVAAPADAKWNPVSMSQQLNGDIRDIFHQKYLSPRPNTVSCRIGYDGWSAWTFQPWKLHVPEISLDKVDSLLDRQQRMAVPGNAVFARILNGKNIAFTSLWDNWPAKIQVPVRQKGEAVWLLVCGNTNPMQGRIANAVFTFHYADGKDERFELIPPLNFWSLCGFGTVDYSYSRDGFALPKTPPLQVQLGTNCRAMVYGWKLRPGVELTDVTLETLSQEVVIGLMGVSIMNPAGH